MTPWSVWFEASGFLLHHRYWALTGAPPAYSVVVLCHRDPEGFGSAGLALSHAPPSHQGEFSSVALLLSCPQVWLATHAPLPALLCCLGDVQGHSAAVVSQLVRDGGSSLTFVTSGTVLLRTIDLEGLTGGGQGFCPWPMPSYG